MPPLTDLHNPGAGGTAIGSEDHSLPYSTQEGKSRDTAHVDLGYLSAPETEPVVVIPDLPPESFWVSASDELDWLDRNTFIQRKGSIKFAITKNFDPSFKPSNRSLSFNNKKPKASIIGPPKSQKFNQAGNTKPGLVENRKLFRSRSESGKDRIPQAPEPGSPRVSCMGRVGSKKKCNRSRSGFWATVRTAFMNRNRRKQPMGQ